MSQFPHISALMSAYNSGEFIEDAIDSVINQTFEDWELIIVNDGSTDDTEGKILSYSDKRIRYVPLKENVGVGKALSIGLEFITAPLIAKVDSDDINHPERFQKQFDFLKENPDITLCKTLIEYFPHNDQVAKSERYRYMKDKKEHLLNSIVTPEDIQRKLYWWSCIPHNSYMAHTNAIKETGYADVTMGEDYKLFYELNTCGYKFSTVADITTATRVHPASVTGSGNHVETFVKAVWSIKEKNLHSLLDKCPSLYIWGTGAMGRGLSQTLKEKDLPSAGFIDSNTALYGTNIEGKPICALDDIVKTVKNVKIIVAAQPVREQVVSQLEQKGLQEHRDFLVFA